MPAIPKIDVQYAPLIENSGGCKIYKVKGVIFFIIFIMMDEEVEKELKKYSIVEKVSAEEMREFMGNGEIIFIDKTRNWAETFISSAIVINAPVQRVWDVVTDFHSYSQYMPLVSNSQERKISENLVDTSFRLTFKVAIIPFSIDFSLLHRLYPYEDITWTLSRDDEDLSIDYGKWEFFPLDDNKRTLAIYSVFTKAKSSFLMKIIEKEPVLDLGFDIALSSAVPKVVKERVEGREWREMEVSQKMKLEKLKNFFERGNVVLLTTSKPLNWYSSFVIFDAPVQRVWDVVTDYKNYNRFVPMVRSVKVKDMKDGSAVLTYEIDFNFIIFKKKTRYSVKQEFSQFREIKWDYHEGEIKGVKGEWNFYEIDGNKTLGVYSWTSDLRSTGFIFKLLLKSFPILEDSIQAAIGAAFTEAVKEEVQRRKEFLH
jgi:ribosome-associated toxin RatA of RatAB toxin-antitoxin module